MVRILTDSTSDIAKSEREALGIISIPITVNFEDGEYKDGVNISVEEFYEKLKKSTALPTTAQINPSEFLEVFQEYVEAGDEIVGIFISSELSGTYQSATIAAEMAGPGKIWTVDSMNVTLGLSLLVYEAVKLRDAGMGAREIAEEIEKLKERVRLLAVVSTLKYLKKGGRLSATSTFIGGILGIAPIISVIGGKIEAVAKATGHNASMRKLLELYDTDPADLSHEVIFGHSMVPEELEDLIKIFDLRLAGKTLKKAIVGSAIGTHTGPGAVGIAYIAK